VHVDDGPSPVAGRGPRRRLRDAVHPTDDGHRVTSFELFFDLVFVFAFTQVTQLMADDATGRGAVRGLVLMALLWFAWCSYSWLGNQARADRGVVRAAMVAAMATMFVVALTIPEAFKDFQGGLHAPFVLAACYALVRLLHLGCYLVAALDDAALRRQVLLTLIPVSGAAALLVLGGALGPPAQTAVWALALLVDYTGIYLAGASGWRVYSPAHFAERYGLIVIVALGESIVALGVGVAGKPVSWSVVAAAWLGTGTAVCLWWLYFDGVAPLAEQALDRATGIRRSMLARDAFTYLHFPIVVSIIFLALGLKKVLEYVADTTDHDLGDPLSAMPLLSLLGGVAVYLLGRAGVRLRCGAGIDVRGLMVAGLVVALAPVAASVPALAVLAALTLVLVVLTAVSPSERVREP
jgi:low temperature requirement protein LtrA